MPLSEPRKSRQHLDREASESLGRHVFSDVPALVERTSQLLRTGVPLTLLLDLAEEHGPRSAQHYASEGGDLSWVRRSG